MTIRSSKRLGALVAASLFVAGACSSTGATPSPSAASQAPVSQPASQPAAASGSTAPSQAAVTCPDPATATLTLQGAGATFPAPLYQTWFETFNGAYSNIQIDYQANGSGAGIKAITEQTVDFGASDAAMKDDEIAALPAGTKILHIPTALGAVVVIFNLPGVDRR